MKNYALKTSTGDVVFMQLLEATDVNQEVVKWEETSNGVTIEAILPLEGIPSEREEREVLREELKAENG